MVVIVWNRPKRIATQAQLVANRRRRQKLYGKTNWKPRIDLTGLWIWRGPVTWRNKE